ncbi:MAG TPA: DEAD/DEAH box helicase [Candidatus Xenobia bacterium]
MPGTLCVWVEACGNGYAMARMTRGRSNRGGTPAHPSALGVDGVRDAISSLLGLRELPAMQAGDLTLDLSSRDGRPLSWGESSAGVSIYSPWRIAVCRLPAAEAALLFGGVMDAPGARTGDVCLSTDLAVWCAAGRQAALRAASAAEADAEDELRIAQLGDHLPEVGWVLWDGCADGRAAVKQFVNLAASGVSELWKRRRALPVHWPEAARKWGRVSLSAPTWLLEARAESTPLTGTPTRWRTCFRLEPPADTDIADTPWSVRFLLQAQDDQSLYLSAEQMWDPVDEGRLAPARQTLVADLRRAARIFPKLEKVAASPRPESVELSLDEVSAFLGQTVWILEESGFSVQIPSWSAPAGGSPLRLHLQVQDRTGDGVLGLDTLVDYRWQVSLGDEVMDPEAFHRLASLKIPLVRMRGQWVLLDRKTVDHVMDLVLRPGRRELTLRDALRLGSGLEGEDDAAAAVDVQLLGRLNSLSGSGGSMAVLPQPAAFVGVLRPYQERGFSWLAFLRDRGLGACLADDMGLGKTIQLIALLLRDRQDRGPQGPTLLISPTTVVGNWERELTRFSPTLKVLVHHGTERLMLAEFIEACQRYDLVITTYGLMVRDVHKLRQVTWEGIVLDEAQNIKNGRSLQARAARTLRAHYRVALTGTPVENRLSELWSIMEFLNPQLLGTFDSFRRRFALPIERRGDTTRLQRLRSILQPFLLRRLKTDPSIVPDLPDKQEMKVYCNLTREQVTLYEATVRHMMERLENAQGMARRGQILTTILRLKQICDHPTLFMGDGSKLDGRSGKLSRLEEMLSELLQVGDKALVFTQFTEMAKLLAPWLAERLGVRVLLLHGGIPPKSRDGLIQEFQTPEGPPIFVLSVKAGGVGLNLTQAQHVFHFDRWWNPAVENQATDRSYRIGQTRNVQVHKFICMGTLEEAIDKLIESKMELAENVIGSGESWLTELDTEQLRSILTLRVQALEIQEDLGIDPDADAESDGEWPAEEN